MLKSKKRWLRSFVDEGFGIVEDEEAFLDLAKIEDSDVENLHNGYAMDVYTHEI